VEIIRLDFFSETPMRHSQAESFCGKSDSETLFDELDVRLPTASTEVQTTPSTAVCTENHALVGYSVLSITPGWIAKPS